MIDNIISRTTDYQLQEDDITTRKSYYTYQKYLLTVCESDRSFQDDLFSHWGRQCNLTYNFSPITSKWHHIPGNCLYFSGITPWISATYLWWLWICFYSSGTRLFSFGEIISSPWQLPFHLNNHTTHTSNIPLLFVNLPAVLGDISFSLGHEI